MWLVYETNGEAIDRADTEGQRRNYAYWSNAGSTRWHTAPEETSNNKWALKVTDYELSTEEQSQTVESI
tara:strand:- start:408 stop:614 length:207 start_codon:yes stop_codon:yes gene_type:complete